MGERKEPGEWVVHPPAIIQDDHDFLFGGVHGPHGAEIPIEYAEVVVVLELEHPVPGAVGPGATARLRLPGMGGIEPLLQPLVQCPHPDLAAVHRGKDLDVTRPLAVPGGQPTRNQFGHEICGTGRLVRRHEETVPRPGRPSPIKHRQVPRLDALGIRGNPGARALPEDG
jgi:hypothetical protein